MGPTPLPAVLERALLGEGPSRAYGAVTVSGQPVAVRYPRLPEMRAAFGAEFAWRRTFALGLCMPGPAHGRWVEAHPQAFGALAMIEGLLRAVPGLRGLGDHVVLEGVRV
jgi:hypothetical protein